MNTLNSAFYILIILILMNFIQGQLQICSSSQLLFNNLCTYDNNCPDDSFNNSHTCICNQGYYLWNNTCLATCPAYSSLVDLNSTCQCNTGYVF